MSETPGVPPKSNNAAENKCSKDQKESSSPCQQGGDQKKTCCEYGRPLTKEHKPSAADTSDIGNRQGQDHQGCPVAQHGSCHQTHEQALSKQGLSSRQPAGADSGDSIHQHSPRVTDQRQISSDQKQISKENHPDDKEGRGCSHTHQHGRHSSDHGSQEPEGRKPSKTSDHKERKVSGTSQADQEGRRPYRTSRDHEDRNTSNSSIQGDKEGRRSSRTSQCQDRRRTSSGASHHTCSRKVSGEGHEHPRRISAAAEAGSGLEVMADLGHSKDKPHHHTANEFKKGGWGRLNSL